MHFGQVSKGVTKGATTPHHQIMLCFFLVFFLFWFLTTFGIMWQSLSATKVAPPAERNYYGERWQLEWQQI